MRLCLSCKKRKPDVRYYHHPPALPPSAPHLPAGMNTGTMEAVSCIDLCAECAEKHGGYVRVRH